jgi:cytochrome c-type biogenesis protein CcmH
MTWLYPVAVVMLLASVWYLLRPLGRAGGGQHASEQWHQLQLVRDRVLGQIRELEQQGADGVIDESVVADERERLEAELAPVLRELEELSVPGESTDRARMPISLQRQRMWLLVMMVFVLPFTIGLYVINGWGTLQGLYGQGQGEMRASTQARGGQGGQGMPPMVMQMVERLEGRLKESPQDPEGWARLGRAYAVLGRIEEARTAYGRAYQQAPNDVAIVSAYAGFLYQMNPQDINGEVRPVYEKLRSLQPEHPGVLWFFGVVAYEAGDFEKAIKGWQRLMQYLPEGSPARTSVQKAIAQAQEEIRARK